MIETAPHGAVSPQYMFHRIIFLLLIVSGLFCNFNRCVVCFQSLMNIACRSTQNAARIKRRRAKITHRYKTIKQKINITVDPPVSPNASTAAWEQEGILHAHA